MILLKFSILLLIFTSPLLSQSINQNLLNYVKTYEDAKISSESKIQEVINENHSVMDLLSSLDIKILALRKYIESMKTDDFIDIIEKRNAAYDQNLFEPAEFWLEHDEELEKNLARDSITFGIYEGILRNNLVSKYGDVLANIILSPILLRIKLVDTEKVAYKIDDENNIGLDVFTAEIEDIIKGQNHFNVGEVIQFYYVSFWLHTEHRFSIGESYFISLLPIVDNKTREKRLALNVNNVNNGITIISNDIVYDQENYYNFGIVSWESFKTKISSLISVNQLKEDIR